MKVYGSSDYFDMEICFVVVFPNKLTNCFSHFLTKCILWFIFTKLINDVCHCQLSVQVFIKHNFQEIMMQIPPGLNRLSASNGIKIFSGLTVLHFPRIPILRKKL